MKITDFTFTHHALARVLDMGIDPDELRACLEHPAVTVREHARRSTDTVYRGQRIACIVSADNAVKTVVWSNPDDWKADLARGGDYNRRFDAAEWQPRPIPKRATGS